MPPDLTGSSFRDPESHLVSDEDGCVVRQFTDIGAAGFREVAATGLLENLVGTGHLVPFEVAADSPLTVVSRRLPIVTYPSEWSPSALKDAALATLHIARTAWEFGAELKDASAYNVVFDHNRPTWVDLGSFKPGRRGIWAAYGQFCDHFLSPLLIDQRLGISHARLWSQSGIPVEVAAALLPLPRHLDRTVLRQVHLRARLERTGQRLDEESRLAIRRDVEIPAAVLPKLIGGLEKAVAKLGRAKVSHWAAYEHENSYDDASQGIRNEFIRRTITGLESRERALDVGCNTGRHSAILSQEFRTVLSLDNDPASIDLLRARQADGTYGTNIWPVVTNILEATASSGLMHEERQSFHSRFDGSDLVLWMAVLHHLVITGDLPLNLFTNLMMRLGRDHIVEFVEPEDGMVRLLTSSKGGIRHDYSRSDFEKAIARLFRVTDTEQATDTRRLYHLSRR
jgi:SAM-dependent methyltransferase